MSADQVLWAVGVFLLGVVGGVRLGVWWFTKVKVASARIDADVAFLQAIPGDDGFVSHGQSPLFDDDGWLR